MKRAPAAALAALVTGSCAAPLMKLPSGPGAPLPAAGAILDEATNRCRSVTTLTAELAVGG